MRKLFLAVALAASLAGCAAGLAPATPEAQIKAGADGLTATTTLATALLRNNKISVPQAKSYRVLLGAASSALDEANTTLLACRKATGSTAATPSDPCRPSVADVITLALDSIGNVKRTLDSKGTP
jgi:hypothetical protein